MQYREVLLQITLPFDAPAPDKHAALLVEPMGGQGQASKATFISASPQTDSTIQGKTYYYSAPADILRAGMRVTARFALEHKNATGVIVPDTAVVWYANKAWVYQQEGADKFVRRQVNTDIEVDSKTGIGWFNASGLKPGDKVVSSGAQLLLSEEFKYQITNENDD
jgi:multidrug efflux pump subunit AcrA (membrane-fusion protein)